MKKFYKHVSILSLLFSFVLPAVALAAGPAGVNLGSASNFAILAKTGISNTGSSYVIGDLGLSPAAASYITGFGLVLPSASAFSTSVLVNGKIYTPGYANPTPANITASVSDMQTAYTDAMGRAPNVTELGAGNIGGLTLTPGVYKWGTGVTIPTNVTLSGGANDVWIFQVAQNLNVSSATQIVVSGGAQSSNIFWVVAGQTTLGTTSVFNGNILDQTAIVLNTGATLNGRALAQTAVTLDSNAVTIPSATGVNVTTSSTTQVPLSSGYQYPAPAPTSSNSGLLMYTAVNTTPTVNYMPGCTATTLFSGTTGQPCSGGTSVVNNTPINAPIPTSYNFGSFTLRNGSTGDAVMELQEFLNAKLNLNLSVDGKLGPKTIAVIKQWQQANGLVADGLVGSKTKAMMNAQTQ